MRAGATIELERVTSEEECPQIVAAVFAAPSVRVPPFELGLRLLLPWSNSPRPGSAPYPGFYAGAVALFGNRVRYESIAHWRAGRRQAPQWIKDMLASHLDRMAQNATEAARLLRESKKAP